MCTTVGLEAEMKCIILTAMAGSILSLAGAARAQVADVVNPGFESPRATNPALPLGWRTFNTATRRFPGDGLMPMMPPVRPGGSGTAMVELRPGSDFSGLDTNILNINFLYNDLAYAWTPGQSYPCGPATCCVWYYIPDNAALLGIGQRGGNGGPGTEVGQSAGLKLEFRRSNSSIYDVFEDLSLAAGTGGEWRQICLTVTRGDWDFIFNYYNAGMMYPDPPNAVSLLPFRFGAPDPNEMPPPPLDDGTIFYDDVTFSQQLGGQGVDLEFWDDREVRLTAKVNGGVIEPSVPLYFNGQRLGFDCVAGDETFNLIDITDRVPNTGAFPLTFADIIANGYIRPLVQKSDGTSSAIGTSVVTHPSFRPNAQPIITVPTITRADADVQFTPPDVPLGLPKRADPIIIQGTGNYGALATVVSAREYPDPAVGQTRTEVVYTWTATQSITLQGGAQGRGFDAFRLVWFSSMLGNLGTGQYDANFIAVENNSGQTRTLAIDDAPRDVYLFGSPQPTGVGRSFTLYKDTDATWNPGSPSIEIEIVSLSLNGGSPMQVGVQGYLAGTTDPNDDSLSVWLEWTDAPATIPAGTTITGTFLVTATPASALGDGNHDGLLNCDDVAILTGLLGQNQSSPTFNAFVDMNGDGTITTADRTLLEALTGPCTPPCGGDANGDNLVNGADLSVLLSQFGQNVAPGTGADFNNDGVVNGADLSVLLSRFGTSC